jgi:hypothetical protein
MGLNIKNEMVERDVRELARLTGLGVTDSIGYAVRDMLNRQRQRDSLDIDSIVAMIDAAHRAGDPPIQDPGDFLYDEHGLPR